MQLPDTAKGIAVRTGGARFVVSELRDPEINVRYGSWYLDHLRGRYDGDLRLALAAYHAGQGNVDRWLADGGGIAFPRRGHTSTRSSASGRVREGVPGRAQVVGGAIALADERTKRVDVADRSPLPSCTAIPFATRLTKLAIFRRARPRGGRRVPAPLARAR